MGENTISPSQLQTVWRPAGLGLLTLRLLALLGFACGGGSSGSDCLCERRANPEPIAIAFVEAEALKRTERVEFVDDGIRGRRGFVEKRSSVVPSATVVSSLR